jgi:uncharacterized protein YecT (DUF1311 family)
METLMFRPTLIALACLAAPAFAQTVDCTAAMAQQDMNICAERDWQNADADLNRTYQEVMSAMQAMDADLPKELQGAEPALREAQRAWISYRDLNCTLAGFPMRGGSAEPLLVYGCLRQMTVNRSDELRALVAY